VTSVTHFVFWGLVVQVRSVKAMVSVCTEMTPFGFVVVKAESELLVDVEIVETVELQSPAGESVSDALREASKQLKAYFRDSSFKFDLPLANVGTAYQRRVWAGLKAIPSGSILAYGQLACELRSGPRAIAAACRANPFPIIVPCHRVVAAHGLGGYAGAREGFQLTVKRWLLQHEGIDCA